MRAVSNELDRTKTIRDYLGTTRNVLVLGQSKTVQNQISRNEIRALSEEIQA